MPCCKTSVARSWPGLHCYILCCLPYCLKKADAISVCEKQGQPDNQANNNLSFKQFEGAQANKRHCIKDAQKKQRHHLYALIRQDILGSLLRGGWGRGHRLGHRGEPNAGSEPVLTAGVKQTLQLCRAIRLALGICCFYPPHLDRLACTDVQVSQQTLLHKLGGTRL